MPGVCSTPDAWAQHGEPQCKGFPTANSKRIGAEGVGFRGLGVSGLGFRVEGFRAYVGSGNNLGEAGGEYTRTMPQVYMVISKIAGP